MACPAPRTNDKGFYFLSAYIIPGTGALRALPRLSPGPSTTCPSPLCLHLPCSPRLAPLHPPGLSWLLGPESHQVQADLRAFAVAVTSSRMLFLHVLWPRWDFGAWSGPLLILVSPAFRPHCRHSIPSLRSTARSCTGKQVTVLVTRHVSPDTVWVLPSVSGTSEPHITLHPHCNPLTHGKALTFQGGQRVQPC